MTEDQETSDAPVCGRQLKRAREQLGLSVDDVASELRLSGFQIRALENDDWGELPGMTYARGYVRSYARLLGLDADQLLDGASTQEIEITRTEPKIEARGPAGGRGTADQAHFPWGWLGVALVVLALAAAYWQHREGWPLIAGGAGADTAMEEAGVDVARVGSSQDVSSPGAVVEAGGPPMPTVPRRVVFQFEAQSWVDVRDAGGERLLNRSVKPGRRIEVEGQPPFSVFLGNAHGVRVEYMGDTLTPAPDTGRIYARFVLGSPSG